MEDRELVDQLNDRIDTITSLINKVIEMIPTVNEEIVTEEKEGHPYRGKASLSIRARYLTIGSTGNIDTIPNNSLFRDAADDLLYYKDNDGNITAK